MQTIQELHRNSLVTPKFVGVGQILSDMSDNVRYCQICQILSDNVRYCQILSDILVLSDFVGFVRFCQILSDFVRSGSWGGGLHTLAGNQFLE